MPARPGGGTSTRQPWNRGLPRAAVRGRKEVAANDPWRAQREALGVFIRTQRHHIELAPSSLLHRHCLMASVPPTPTAIS